MFIGLESKSRLPNPQLSDSHCIFLVQVSGGPPRYTTAARSTNLRVVGKFYLNYRLIFFIVEHKSIDLQIINILLFGSNVLLERFSSESKDVMQGKLFQMCTHLLYCSVLSLGGNVNTRRMLQPDMGSIFHIKKIYEIFWSGKLYVNYQNY